MYVNKRESDTSDTNDTVLFGKYIFSFRGSFLSLLLVLLFEHLLMLKSLVVLNVSFWCDSNVIAQSIVHVCKSTKWSIVNRNVVERKVVLSLL